MTQRIWLSMFVGTLGGVSVQTMWPVSYAWYVVVTSVCVTWALWMTGNKKIQAVGWAGLFFVLGLISMQMHQQNKQTWTKNIQSSLRKTTVLDVDVQQHPALYQEYATVKVRVIASDKSTSLIGETLWLKMKTFQYPKRGDQIRVRGRVHIDTWLGESRLRMNVQRDEDWALLMPASQLWHTVLPKVKNIFASHASGTTWMIHRALSMGEGQALPSAIKEQLKHMGIIHLFVFSGFHVGVLFFLFSWSLQMIARLVSRRWPHRSLHMYAYALALTMTSIYVFLLVRWSLPTLRALVFLAVGLICYGRGWVIQPLQWLCIALTFFLLIDPSLLQSPSALLSFCAVTGIVWTLQVAKQQKLKKKRWYSSLLYACKQNAYIAWAAFMWTAPVLVYFFQKVNLMSVVYNFILVPTFGSCMIALSIFNNIWAMIFQGTTGLSYGIALQEWVTFLFLDVISFLQKTGSLTVSIENIGIWWVAMFYGCLIISYMTLEWQKKKKIPLTGKI